MVRVWDPVGEVPAAMKPFHFPTSLVPESTATLNLGKDDLRWLEAFLTNLNVSVRATVPTPVNATDAATKGYVDGLFVPVIATIDEADGSPSIVNATTLRFDQADGLVLTNPSVGIARVDLSAIPYSVIQNVSATDRLLGRSTAGAGTIEEIVATAAGRALIDDATAAAQRTTLGSTTVGDAVFIAASAAAARTTLGVVIGTDVQAWDADLDAVAALAATAGMLSRTGAGAFAARTITGTTSNISVADGTGAAGNPTLDLVNAGPGATGPIGSSTVAPVVTIDAKGRVTALTSATISTTAQGALVTRTAGDVTTTSTTLVDFTGATATFTTGANRALVGFTGTTANSGLSGDNIFNVDVDGSLQLGTSGILVEEGVADNYNSIGLNVLTAALTAASHTLKIQWRVSAGTGTVRSDSTYASHFYAKEVL